jgi:hypothetical protein
VSGAQDLRDARIFAHQLRSDFIIVPGKGRFFALACSLQGKSPQLTGGRGVPLSDFNCL